MTKREQRVISAFENCIEHKEYSIDYAIILIEDTQRYGWLSDNAKNAFYDWLDAYDNRIEEALPVVEIEEVTEEIQTEE